MPVTGANDPIDQNTTHPQPGMACVRFSQKNQTSRMCVSPIWWLLQGAQNPIPSRTRPLNPFAPMVLSLKTWESRSPPGLQNALKHLFMKPHTKQPRSKRGCLRSGHRTRAPKAKHPEARADENRARAPFEGHRSGAETRRPPRRRPVTILSSWWWWWSRASRRP